MANFFRSRRPKKPMRQSPVIGSDDYLDLLSKEFKLSPEQVLTTLRGLGYDPEHVPADQKDLLREILACKVHDLSSFKTEDPAYEEKLDGMLRDFDEIYVDTAPIIQMDWFLHFIADAEPILKRRKKKVLILEKTMEELHGLKDNPEKDREVRIRATIRPDLIRNLARRGVVRIGDTGSTGIADDHLVKLFSRIGRNENLLLVTQDRGLSERIVRLDHEMKARIQEPIPQTWWERLTRKEPQYQKDHAMVVCKLTENGILKRCYICPDCQESYYDEFSECDAMVPCSKCILVHKEKSEQANAANVRKEQQEAKRKEQEEALKNRATVEKRLEENRRKARILLLSALGVLLLCIILVLCL